MRVLYLVAIWGVSAFGVPFAFAQDVSGADIVILGEVHDNPAHHAHQARLIATIAPTAVVYEMLSEEQAAVITPDLVDDETALRRAIAWDATGWPDFAMYYPLFAVAPQALVVGAAVPRENAQQAMESGVGEIFGDQSSRFGLSDALPKDQQVARLALQKMAHCDALPDDMLTVMVDIQRLRDAVLARAALGALAETAGPVVVITGNGHARKDWGVPAILSRVAPSVSVISVGQGETGQAPDGEFDTVLMSDPVERTDPCLAFR
ncbi:MAG: ChaN family lipoprotein [Paracoccaceae bacterium]